MKLTGEDRRGTKRELAAALIIAHGVDLFRHRGIRSLVAKRTDVAFPNRWHPGKGAALEFVRDVRFPPELTGIPAEDTPVDFEYLEGRVDLKPLEAVPARGPAQDGQGAERAGRSRHRHAADRRR